MRRAESTGPRSITEEQIRERAYSLWEARGRASGDAEADWFAAEELLKAERDAASPPLPPLTIEAAHLVEKGDGVVKPVGTRKRRK
jgi:hypothetical protein